MLKPSRSHQEFQIFVKEQLQLHYLKYGLSNPILLNHKSLAAVWLADLSKVVQIVSHRYCASNGSPARDPVDLFRSLLLMKLIHERSINSWVNTMRSNSIFAILSGFSPMMSLALALSTISSSVFG